MPLPILFAAAAAATSTWPSVTVLVSVMFGSAAAGAGSFWYYCTSGSNPGMSPEHQASLLAQQALTMGRISLAGDAVEGLTAEVKAANIAATTAAADLHASTDKIASTSTHLAAAALATDAAGRAIGASVPDLEALAGQVHDDAIIIGELEDFLATTEGRLTQARTDVVALTAVVTVQAADIVRLGGLVETLTVENKALDSDMGRLRVETDRVRRQVLFFKQVAEEALAEKEAHEPGTARPS